ncbi:hypothetical protein EO087_12650 [Dyella sp. M7H15-1]|uniref:hypothetical protein n=1 Tax=Dyella sp. M7H15-1 TaxID=2501295 RepID=UPI001004FD0E|nr:hypothetical protein [Dyella sp. M7H15-1]QAU24732.1 hypothetical protein EO087_12650 [Dyella sp. M7H15-1]
MTTKRLFLTVMPWLLLVVIGLLTAWLRYGFIEPPALAHSCDDGNTSASCSMRTFIVLGFNTYSFGIAALVITALAFVRKNIAIAWLAAALGIFAIIMYCYYAGAMALLVGCLRWVNLQKFGMPTPGDQNRDSNRQVQAQP